MYRLSRQREREREREREKERIVNEQMSKCEGEISIKSEI